MLSLQVIGVWGDIGHTPNSTDTRNHLLANNPEIVYNTADFVYAGERHLLARAPGPTQHICSPGSPVYCIMPVLYLLVVFAEFPAHDWCC